MNYSVYYAFANEDYNSLQKLLAIKNIKHICHNKSNYYLFYFKPSSVLNFIKIIKVNNIKYIAKNSCNTNNIVKIMIDSNLLHHVIKMHKLHFITDQPMIDYLTNEILNISIEYFVPLINIINDDSIILYTTRFLIKTCERDDDNVNMVSFLVNKIIKYQNEQHIILNNLWNAFFAACENSNYCIAQYLLDGGIAKNKLTRAIYLPHKKIVSYLERGMITMIEYLLDMDLIESFVNETIMEKYLFGNENPDVGSFIVRRHDSILSFQLTPEYQQYIIFRAVDEKRLDILILLEENGIDILSNKTDAIKRTKNNSPINSFLKSL